MVADDILRAAVHDNGFDFSAAAVDLKASHGCDLDADGVRLAFAALAKREREELERLKKTKDVATAVGEKKSGASSSKPAAGSAASTTATSAAKTTTSTTSSSGTDPIEPPRKTSSRGCHTSPGDIGAAAVNASFRSTNPKTRAAESAETESLTITELDETTETIETGSSMVTTMTTTATTTSTSTTSSSTAISSAEDPEPSDFTIFTHCLKTRVAEIYTDVKSRLPVIGSDEDEDDDDIGGDGAEYGVRESGEGPRRGVPEIVKSRYWGTEQGEMDRVIASLLSGDLASLGDERPPPGNSSGNNKSSAAAANLPPFELGAFEGVGGGGAGSKRDSDDDDVDDKDIDKNNDASSSNNNNNNNNNNNDDDDDDDDWQYSEHDENGAVSHTEAADNAAGMDPSMALIANMAQGLMQALTSGEDPSAAMQALERDFFAALAGGGGSAGGDGDRFTMLENAGSAAAAVAEPPALRIDESLSGLDLDAMLRAASEGTLRADALSAAGPDGDGDVGSSVGVTAGGPRTAQPLSVAVPTGDGIAADASTSAATGDDDTHTPRVHGGQLLDGNGDAILPSPKREAQGGMARDVDRHGQQRRQVARGGGGGRYSRARGAVPLEQGADSDDDSSSDDDLIDRSKFKMMRESEIAPTTER